ncbi:MAG TPA: thioesterase family protein [Gemmatimonadaceae bacterium]|nr:thioesterase family protein [Gemmatimonadaceae bacterium]
MSTADSRPTAEHPAPHVSEFRVRYAETDRMGVVYHAEYLVWCEIGRTDFIRTHYRSYADLESAGVLLAVAEANVRYHAGARYDELVRVETRLAEVRSRTLRFEYLIRRAETGERLASASTTLVAVDPQGRGMTLPAEVREALAAHAG